MEFQTLLAKIRADDTALIELEEIRVKLLRSPVLEALKEIAAPKMQGAVDAMALEGARSAGAVQIITELLNFRERHLVKKVTVKPVMDFGAKDRMRAAGFTEKEINDAS